MEQPVNILAINAGSSSLKAALFEAGAQPRKIYSADLEITAGDSSEALDLVLKHFGATDASRFIGVGHRVVHGGPNFHDSVSITPDLLAELRRLIPFDPQHLPAQIALIEAAIQRFPGVAQIACFDTAFHHDLPAAARRLAVPRKFDDIGVRRYGFHGLSLSYLIEELRRIDPAGAGGRVILAHLGNGASITAVRGGRSIDTSMALTPSAGIPMSTRTGDIDPGLVGYLGRVGGISVDQFNHMIHFESGLLGISETTGDMRRLTELEATDGRAAEAVEIFCYNVRKWIGAYAAALGGLDRLVFSGGIGEHAYEVRRRVCENLGFLGITLDAERNRQSAEVISSGPVKVRVIATDEEQMIAREVVKLAGNRAK